MTKGVDMDEADTSVHASVIKLGVGIFQALDGYSAAVHRCWRTQISIDADGDDTCWLFSLSSVISRGVPVLVERFGLFIGADSEGSNYFVTIGNGLLAEMSHRIAHETLGVGGSPYAGADAVSAYEHMEIIVRPSSIDWP
jgi:hypothetical protein